MESVQDTSALKRCRLLGTSNIRDLQRKLFWCSRRIRARGFEAANITDEDTPDLVKMHATCVKFDINFWIAGIEETLEELLISHYLSDLASGHEIPFPLPTFSNSYIFYMREDQQGSRVESSQG